MAKALDYQRVALALYILRLKRWESNDDLHHNLMTRQIIFPDACTHSLGLGDHLGATQ